MLSIAQVTTVEELIYVLQGLPSQYQIQLHGEIGAVVYMSNNAGVICIDSE